MNFLFPYLARWKAANWTRYHGLFTQLARMGYPVRVYQPPASIGSKETNYIDLDISVHPNIELTTVKIPEILWNFPYPRKTAKLFKKGFYSLYAKKEIFRDCKTTQPDMLFLYNIPQYQLASMKNSLIVFDLADDLIEMLKEELPPVLSPLILPSARKKLDYLLHKSDLIIAASKDLQRKYPNSFYLPNGINFEEIPTAESHPELKVALNIPQARKVIGFLGAFEYFIDFKLYFSLAQALPENTFLLVGAGRKFEYAKQLASDMRLSNCIFTGAVPHKDVWKYISIMDVCINPFNDHPVAKSACPIKVFEYMAMKRPVITTPLLELQELADRKMMYSTHSVKEMAEICQKLVNDTTHTRELTENGYLWVKKELDWEYLAQQFITKTIPLIEQKKMKQSSN